jgi:hypothetical protein
MEDEERKAALLDLIKTLYGHMRNRNLMPNMYHDSYDIKTETMKYCANTVLRGAWEFTVYPPIDKFSEATITIGEFLDQ